MLHDIGVALQTKLRARGCPLNVIDGPEPTGTTTWGRQRIVIEHDEGDGFSTTLSQRPNTAHRMNRGVASKITIYAQSTRSGAKDFEHRDLAEHVLDMVLVCLGDVASTASPPPVYNVWSADGGSFIVPADLAESERRAGAVYELKVTFQRAVKERTWDREIAAEATVGGDEGVGITSTTQTSINGVGGSETACGA